MKGHLRHGTGTDGTEGDGIEVGAASRLHPWVQVVPVGEALSKGPGTWELITKGIMEKNAIRQKQLSLNFTQNFHRSTVQLENVSKI